MILPKEYQPVEYIESTGTQYIDTGINPNQFDKSTIKMSYSVSSTEQVSGQQAIYGSQNSSSPYNTKILRYDYITSLRQWAGGVTYKSILNANEIYDIEHFYTATEASLKLNGVVVATASNQNYPFTDYNIYLFALNNGGSPSQQLKGKLYSCAFYAGDNVVRNFIPCYRKSDNVIGMYDLVNNTFYTNQGTGTFLKGKYVGNTTASKSSYLIETKELIKEKINFIGGELTDENTFREYAEELENLYNDFPKVTGKGSEIVLNNTRKGRLAITPEGNTVQETTEGYNLLPISLESKNNYGVSIVINDNKSITLDGKATSYFQLVLFEGEVNLNQDTYVYSLGSKQNGINFIGVENGTEVAYLTAAEFNTSKTRILDEEKTISKVFCAISNGAQFDNFTIFPQIIKGIEKKEYEPYTGGQASPNPNYKQDIKVVTGKTLLKIKNGAHIEPQELHLDLTSKNILKSFSQRKS